MLCGGTRIEWGRTCAGDSASAAQAPSLLLDGDEDNRDDQPYDSFKIISRKALSDYKKAERIFLDFLASADVWSQDEVTATIIDFHLVEKCRTKFRAFVKSHGARVKFDPVEGTPRKQEYHGTVTVTRACKQQFLTQHPQVLRPGKTVCPPGEHTQADQSDRVILQCAAPTPITTGAQHIPFSADDALDVAWDRPQLAPDFVSPRQAFHGQPSPRDTTTGVPPVRVPGQDAPVTGTGSLGALPWVALEPRVASQPRAGAESTTEQAGADAQSMPAWRALDTHMIKTEPGRFGEEGPKERAWPDGISRGPGLTGLSLSQTLAGHGLRDLPAVSTRPRRLSLQDAFTSQICPPGLPGLRPTSISATGEDLLSHMHAGASNSLGMFDSSGTPRRPLLRARRTSAPVGAGIHSHTPFSSIAEIPERSNAADWFTRPPGDPVAAMPPVGVRRMSEVHNGPHLSPRKSIRLDTSLHDAAPMPLDSQRNTADPAHYAHLSRAAPDAGIQDPFAAPSLDTLLPSLQHLPPPAHRLRRQSDTDLLSGAAAAAPDNDLEGLRQLLSTDNTAQRQALSALLPPRMASLEVSQGALPASGAGGAAESKASGPPQAEGVAEALLDSDPGMRCASYSFPSVSPSQASPVGSPARPGGGGLLWGHGGDGGLGAKLVAPGVGPLLSGFREGSGSDFGDVARGAGRQFHALGSMPRSLADLQGCGPLGGLDRDGPGFRGGGLHRSLSARECPVGDEGGHAAAGAAGGSGCEATDSGQERHRRLLWPESDAERFQIGCKNKPKRTSM